MSRVRVPEVAVGLLLVVLCAIGAVLWHLSATERTPALALASAVARGDTIEPSDLRVVYIAADGDVEHLSQSRMAEIDGRVALVDLPAGTLISPSMVSGPVDLAEGDGVVGLLLDPGQYPSSGLATGDVINVVQSASAAPSAQDGNEGSSPGANIVIASSAIVYQVEDFASDRKLVSIRATAADAAAVAAVADGSLRLVLVGP